MQRKQPRINLEPTWFDRVLDGLSFTAMILMWVIVVVEYPNLPERIPIHFDLKGNIDNYRSRHTIFLLPAIISVVITGMTFLNRHPHIFNYPVKITDENAFSEYSRATRLIRVVKLIIVAFVNLMIYEMIRSAKVGHSTLPAWVLIAFIILLMAPVAVAVYRSRKGKP